MRELSLFTGAGGGILGSKFLGWRTVGYVEFNDYCQRVIKQRITDGILENAPIFGDIRAFNSEGYAESYKGMVDVVTGGFPCQPFSVAGKQLGADDPRNMWPETIRTIRTVQPRFAFLENVSGLLGSGYFGTVIGDLSESGYDCRYRVLSAAEMGAPHKRDRLWIVANSRRFSERGPQSRGDGEGAHNQLAGRSEALPDTTIERLQERSSEKNQSARFSEQPERLCSKVPDTNKFNDDSTRFRTSQISQHRETRVQHNSWWSTEPELGRVANGVANRVDRLKAVGNGQVPAVVRAAWRILSEGLV